MVELYKEQAGSADESTTRPVPAPAPPAGLEVLNEHVAALEEENRSLKARVRALELTVDRLVEERTR